MTRIIYHASLSQHHTFVAANYTQRSKAASFLQERASSMHIEDILCLIAYKVAKEMLLSLQRHSSSIFRLFFSRIFNKQPLLNTAKDN